MFNNVTNLIDFRVDAPVVKASDPWAGQHIGIQFLSLYDPLQLGGYWDLDNVRLNSFTPPTLSAPSVSNGQFSFQLQSEPGLRFEILATTNIAAPGTNWTVVGTVTNANGSVPFSDPVANASHRFYQARQLP